MNEASVKRMSKLFLRKLAEVGGIKRPSMLCTQLERIFTEVIAAEQRGNNYELRLDQLVDQMFGIGRMEMRERLRPYFEGLKTSINLIEELAAEDYEDCRFDDVRELLEPFPEDPKPKRKRRP